eukprot:14228016-Heterocapsa_arctica.AAC.1
MKPARVKGVHVNCAADICAQRMRLVQGNDRANWPGREVRDSPRGKSGCKEVPPWSKDGKGGTAGSVIQCAWRVNQPSGQNGEGGRGRV